MTINEMEEVVKTQFQQAKHHGAGNPNRIASLIGILKAQEGGDITIENIGTKNGHLGRQLTNAARLLLNPETSAEGDTETADTIRKTTIEILKWSFCLLKFLSDEKKLSTSLDDITVAILAACFNDTGRQTRVNVYEKVSAENAYAYCMANSNLAQYAQRCYDTILNKSQMRSGKSLAAQLLQSAEYLALQPNLDFKKITSSKIDLVKYNTIARSEVPHFKEFADGLLSSTEGKKALESFMGNDLESLKKEEGKGK
jgi:hypothetical protein